MIYLICMYKGICVIYLLHVIYLRWLYDCMFFVCVCVCVCFMCMCECGGPPETTSWQQWVKLVTRSDPWKTMVCQSSRGKEKQVHGIPGGSTLWQHMRFWIWVQCLIELHMQVCLSLRGLWWFSITEPVFWIKSMKLDKISSPNNPALWKTFHQHRQCFCNTRCVPATRPVTYGDRHLQVNQLCQVIAQNPIVIRDMYLQCRFMLGCA